MKRQTELPSGALKKDDLVPIEAPGEERFVLFINNKKIEGDGIRALRQHCRSLSIEKWKCLMTQGKFLHQFSRQIVDHSDNVLSMCHDCGFFCLPDL